MAENPDPIDWIGKSQSQTGEIDAKQTELLAITLDCPIPDKGARLPPCWHWAWFNEAKRKGELGRDGHPKRGGFMPPIVLPRRMWAGGSFEFFNPLIVGSTVTKTSTIKDIVEKEGRSGKLCILTIQHDWMENENLCIREEQKLVYREDPEPDAPALEPPEPPQNPELTREIMPDPVTMFRYSALTFNGHRIHYDADYARNVEGYPDIVFHAPLTATHLCNLAQTLAKGKPLKQFSYRATSPLFANETFTVNGKHTGDNELTLWATTPQGKQAMQASVKL